jgi:hypothetical protein
MKLAFVLRKEWLSWPFWMALGWLYVKWPLTWKLV